MEASKKSGNVIIKQLPVYFVLLAIAGLEIVLAYQGFSSGVLIAVLLALAFCGGALAVMYFMHLNEERRGLFWTLIPALLFVLIMMNMLWSDGFRLLHMRPFAH